MKVNYHHRTIIHKSPLPIAPASLFSRRTAARLERPTMKRAIDDITFVDDVHEVAVSVDISEGRRREVDVSTQAGTRMGKR